MRKLLTLVGWGVALLSGLMMFGFWFSAFVDWMGILGGILAFLLTPGVVIFPLVFWVVEGVFPVFYFVLWAIGAVGMITAGWAMEA